mmetsp:Transcript_43902/g.82447  ORF Transcript_43902/g.82447 Transcript_43902/m.82447 type:complete len:824 (+) Transcript_43902:129-2600(+)
MTNVLGTAGTPRGTESGEFMLRSEIGGLESRIVRHVEEVTAGSEATQNLHRRELQQEVERHAERHSVHLCKIEATCMELTCRLNDAEQRWSAAQQDTMAELTSIQGRLEAFNNKSLSHRMDETDKRLQSSRQELFAEAAKLRAEFTARSEEAANERKLEFRSRTDQLEARIEEMSKVVAETAGFNVRLGAVEQQLAVARAHPSTATLDAKISTLTARVEAAEVKCRDLEHQAEVTVKEAMKSAAAATPNTTSPATALLVERLQARVEETERQLAAGNKLDQSTKSGDPESPSRSLLRGEIEELRLMVNDSRSHMELMNKSFTGERQEYQKLLANVHKRQADEQASLAHVVGEMDAELRVELASRAREIDAKLRAELKADIETRIGATERDAIASVKESLGAGFQAALSELMNHVKKLQSASAEAVNIGPRIANIENELRGTTRLVTSLANRALDDSQSITGFRGTPADDEIGRSTRTDLGRSDLGRSTTPGPSKAITKSDMMGVIETAIRGAFPGSSGKYPVGKMREADGAAPSVSTAEVSSDRARHEDSEGSQATFSEDHHMQYSQKDSAMPDGLLESLQGLANAIDKTIGTTARSSSPVQHGRSITAVAAPDMSPMVSTRGVFPGGSARFQLNPNASDMVDLGADEPWVDGVPPRGRSVEQAKTVSKAAAQQRPHTTLGAPRPSSMLTVPTDKAAVKRQISAAMQPGRTSPRESAHTPLSARPGRHTLAPETPRTSMDVPVGAVRMESGSRIGKSVEVSAASGCSVTAQAGGQTVRVLGTGSPTLSYRPVTPVTTGGRQGVPGTASPAAASRQVAYGSRLA